MSEQTHDSDDAGTDDSPTGQATTVLLENLTKDYGSLRAVQSVDLAIEPGEFLVIVGPSGCGKSTTLRMIAGLETITEGKLYFDNRDVTELDASERNVAMVFQNYALYPHMSARRNITFGMKSAGDYTDEEIDRRVEEAATVLDIADLLDRKPKALSGGERQRIALGRAICRDPDVFLMDEPLSNLDAKLRVQMRAELSRLHDELGTTTVYVTHDQTEAMTLGDRVAVLNAGELQQVAPPQELYDFPANRFVGTFIGEPSMNMLPVDIEDEHAVHDSFSFPLPGYSRSETTATLGIRPEDFEVVSKADIGRPTLEAGVTVTEPLGDTLLLHCRTDSGDAFKVQTSPRSEFDAGDRVTLTCDPERLHLFDAETGEAVYHSARAMDEDNPSEVESSSSEVESNSSEVGGGPSEVEGG